LLPPRFVDLDSHFVAFVHDSIFTKGLEAIERASAKIYLVKVKHRVCAQYAKLACVVVPMEPSDARRYRGSNACRQFSLSLEAISPATMTNAPARGDRDE